MRTKIRHADAAREIHLPQQSTSCLCSQPGPCAVFPAFCGAPSVLKVDGDGVLVSKGFRRPVKEAGPSDYVFFLA